MALIQTEVFAQMAQEKYLGKVVVRNLATDLGVLEGQVGQKVAFPKFKTISDVTDMTKFNGSTDKLVSEQLAQEDSEATIVQKGKSIFIRDYDSETALGNFIQNASDQVGTVIARAVDTDLLTECAGTSLKTATAAAKVITATEINSGLQNFGDDCNTQDMAGIVVNSLLLGSFFAMPEFVDITKTYNAGQTNGIVRNQLVGYFRGIPVFTTDKGTYNSTTSECNSYIIKKNALAYMEKRGLQTEQQRDANMGGTYVVANLIYAVKRLDDSGIVVLKKTIV